MAADSKRRKALIGKLDRNKSYSVLEAMQMVKGAATAKFDESVDVALHLGVDPRHADQIVRGTVGLPAGTGKDVRVAVFAAGEAAAAAREAGADLVLGSRYVPGGSIPNWGALRRFVSLGGNIYAQVFLQSRIRDLTGGFKCFRRRVLESIPLDAIDSKGYAFQIEMSFRAVRKGFRIVEIPIVFVDRTDGESKMSRSIVREAVWMVWWLRLQALLGRL